MATRGDTFDIGDAFAPTGTPFMSPDDILLYLDGTIFISDGGGRDHAAQSLFKIAAEGGVPTPLVTPETVGSPNMFNPYGMAIW